MIHYDGAGGLATIIMAFVAGMKWRKDGWHDHNPVTKTFNRMWIILEPVIFALIGTEIQIHKINPETLGRSIAVLVVALVIRMIGWGEDILTLAVMSILITAPFGAIFILALGPKFLDADEGYAKDFTRSMSQRHSHKDKENVSDL